MFASIDVILNSLCLLFLACVATDLQNNCSVDLLADCKSCDFTIFTSQPLRKFASLFRLSLNNNHALDEIDFVENSRMVIKLTQVNNFVVLV